MYVCLFVFSKKIILKGTELCVYMYVCIYIYIYTHKMYIPNENFNMDVLENTNKHTHNMCVHVIFICAFVH